MKTTPLARSSILRASCLAALGLAVAGKAEAAPTVGPEYEIDAPIFTEEEIVPRTMLRTAFNGSIHLALFAADGALRARRIGTDGSVMDGADIILDTDWTGSYNILSAIPDGEDFLVLWYTPQGGRFGRIDSGGALVSVAPCAVEGGDAQLVRGGAGILVSTTAGLMLVDENGSTLVPLTQPIADTSCVYPSVDYVDGVYLYTCRRYHPVEDDYIKAIRVGEDLQPIDASATVVVQATNLDGIPKVSAAGTEFLLSYGTTARRVSTAGTMSAPYAFPDARTVVYAAGVYHVIYAGPQPDRYRRYGSNLVAIDPAPIDISDLDVYSVDLKAGPSGAVVAMLEHDGNVRATALGANANIIEADALVSSNLALKANAQTELVAATNADGISLLLWRDEGRGVLGMRMGPSGDPLDDEPFSIGGGHYGVKVASNGDTFLIMYNRHDSPVECHSCNYSRQISADGTIGEPTPSFRGTDSIGAYTLTSDGDGYGCVLSDHTGIGGDDPYPVAGVTDQYGVAAMPNALDLPGAGDGHAGVAVAFAGSHYLVAYSSYVMGPEGPEDAVLRTVRMSTDGVVDDFPLAVDSGGSPDLAHRNGTTLLVYTRDGVSLGTRLDANNQIIDSPSFYVGDGGTGGLVPTSTGFLLLRTLMTSDRGIEAVALDGEGQPVDSYVLTDEVGDETNATILNGGKFVVYLRFDPTPDVETTRIRVRKLFNPQPLGAPCEAADECDSTFCADGVCCESSCEDGICDASGACVPSSSGDGGAGGAGGTSSGGSGEGGGASPPTSAGGGNAGDDQDSGSGCGIAPAHRRPTAWVVGILGAIALGRARSGQRRARELPCRR